MINTTYEDLLFDIQKNFENHSSIAELLPTPEEQIFDINLETRTIEVPQFLSVRYDHNAEVIYFRCARYLDNIDLVNMVCIIEYINAEGTPGLYWVPYYDVNNYQKEGNNENPTILIPWVVDKLVTKEAGEVTFTVRFYKLTEDGKTYLYNMSIQPAKGEILHGMDITHEEIEDFEIEASEIQRIYARISESQDNATTYWVDL